MNLQFWEQTGKVELTIYYNRMKGRWAWKTTPFSQL